MGLQVALQLCLEVQIPPRGPPLVSSLKRCFVEMADLTKSRDQLLHFGTVSQL